MALDELLAWIPSGHPDATLVRAGRISSGCPRTSPSSWTATAAGPRSGICRASRATGPASTPCATPSKPPPASAFKVLTLYAFSVENWKRPASEVGTLMVLLKRYLRSELNTLLGNNIRFSVIGRMEELAPDIQDELDSAIAAHGQQHAACCSTSR